MFLKKTDFTYFRLVYLSDISSKASQTFRISHQNDNCYEFLKGSRNGKLGVANMKGPYTDRIISGSTPK
jgi:hypothetical protein